MIAKALERDAELRNHLELHNQILIDTVHKFQGDERDVIVFSSIEWLLTPAPSYKPAEAICFRRFAGLSCILGRAV